MERRRGGGAAGGFSLFSNQGARFKETVPPAAENTRGRSGVFWVRGRDGGGAADDELKKKRKCLCVNQPMALSRLILNHETIAHDTRLRCAQEPRYGDSLLAQRFDKLHCSHTTARVKWMTVTIFLSPNTPTLALSPPHTLSRSFHQAPNFACSN